MKTTKPVAIVKTPHGDLTPRRIANRVVKTSRSYLQALRKAIYLLNRDPSRRSAQTYEQLKGDIIRNLRRHYKMPATANINKEKQVITTCEAQLSLANKFSVMPLSIPVGSLQNVQQRINKLETSADLTKEEQEELDKLQKLLQDYDQQQEQPQEKAMHMETAGMFDNRHYHFLANFAAKHLNPKLTDQLTDMLQEENPKFKPERFHRAVQKYKPSEETDIKHHPKMPAKTPAKTPTKMPAKTPAKMPKVMPSKKPSKTPSKKPI